MTSSIERIQGIIGSPLNNENKIAISSYLKSGESLIELTNAVTEAIKDSLQLISSGTPAGITVDEKLKNQINTYQEIISYSLKKKTRIINTQRKESCLIDLLYKILNFAEKHFGYKSEITKITEIYNDLAVKLTSGGKLGINTRMPEITSPPSSP